MAIEIGLALFYSLFLIALAWGLERLGRKSFRRGDPYLARGFHFRHELDVLECPQGEYLLPVGEQEEETRYKALGERCRGCEMEKFCTDIDTARDMADAQPWIQQEIGQFYRGMSFTLFLLAGFILSVALVAYGQRVIEIAVLGTSLLTTTRLGLRNLRTLRIQ